MKMALHPRKGADRISFGMKRAAVRKLFQEIPTTTIPSKYRPNPLDIFETFEVQVNYNSSDEVVALEFTNDANLIFKCRNLNKMTAVKMRKFLEKQRVEFEETEDSIISYGLGLSAYYPYKDSEPDNIPQTILVFKDGYWD